MFVLTQMNNLSKYIDWAIVITISLAVFFVRFFYEDQYQYFFFTDDFFYYLKIAENYSVHGFPTFNGLVETNGFHPLWQYILIIASFSPINLLFFVTILQLFSSITSFYFLNMIFREYEIHSNIPSLIITLQVILLLRGGMEVIIAIPLLLFFILLVKQKKILFSIIIGSFLILSRLDSIFIVLLVYLSYLSNINKKLVLYLFFGSLPVLIYLLFNKLNFNHILPVSGAAKQLKSNLLPVTYGIRSLFAIFPAKLLVGGIPILLLLFNIFHLVFYKNRTKIDLILNLFPILFLLHQSIFSGWHLWLWYCYIFIPSTIYFFARVFPKIISVKGKITIITLRVFILSATLFMVLKKNPTTNPGYKQKLNIVNFMEDKDGIVAMGDRAGLIGYLINNPIIHLEGLVMNHKFLDYIKSGNLYNVFKDYNVDYYITITAEEINDRWVFSEPHKHHSSVFNMKLLTNTKPTYESGKNFLDYKIFDVNDIEPLD
jgi:hypothetical protein